MPKALKRINILNQKFGKLTVIEFSGISIQNNGMKLAEWKCKCDCGNIVIKKGTYLRTGETTSCGCALRKGLGEAPFNKLYSKYKKNAKIRNYKWELDEFKFKQLSKENCYYCGIEPKQIVKAFSKTTKKEWFEKNIYIYNGIDRIDNKLGYTLNNCVPCCKVCNQAKTDLSENEFKEWIIRIYNNWIKF